MKCNLPSTRAVRFFVGALEGHSESMCIGRNGCAGLAHALENERSKGHGALHPDVARQRRQLLKHIHPDNAPKYAHCTPVQMLEQLTKKVTA